MAECDYSCAVVIEIRFLDDIFYLLGGLCRELVLNREGEPRKPLGYLLSVLGDLGKCLLAVEKL